MLNKMPINFIDFLYHSCGLFILILSILVLASNVKQRNNWLFFFWSLGASGWIESLWWGFYFFDHKAWSSALFFFRIGFAFAALGVAFMTMFFYFFPRILKPVDLKYKLLFLATTGFIVSSSLTNFVHQGFLIENGTYLSDRLGPGYILFTLFILFNYFIAVYLATQKYKLSSGIEKKKLSYVTFGNFAFISLVMITNLILPAFGIVSVYLQQASPILTLAFVVPTFFALQRYRFFNFSNGLLNLLRKIITYGTYLTTVLLTYVFFEPLLKHGILRGIISAMIGIVIFKMIEKRFPFLETSGFKNFKNALTRFKSKIYYLNRYHELEKLVEEVFLLELNFVNAKVFVVRKKADDLELNIYKENLFTKKISKFNKELLIKEEISFIKIDATTKKLFRDELSRLNADLCLPLFSEKNLIGFFILKQDNSNNLYSTEVLREVFSLKKDLEIGLMNILLKTNLQEENDLMKSIINQKTKELKNKIHQINELVDQQSDFIAVTAHEFRTPLSIASFLLEDIIHSKSPGNNLEELKMVDAALANLKELTEKLFAVQQYDLNKVSLNPQRTAMLGFVKNIYKEFQSLVKEKNQKIFLKLSNKREVYSNVDQVQLRQVLHNLLKNASKFAHEGGVIIISVKKSKNFLVLCIEDNGPGIPSHLKKSIFEKFRTKSSGAGIGLGLYLCKKIVELHKGKIWVEDAKNKGAVFCIQLHTLSK